MFTKLMNKFTKSDEDINKPGDEIEQIVQRGTENLGTEVTKEVEVDI